MNSDILSPQMIKIIISVAVVCLAYLAAIILKKIINRRIKDLYQKHSYRKIITYSLTFSSLIFLAVFWIENVAALGAILGGLGAAIAIALHKPILRIFAWITIITNQLYKIGDRIQIGDMIGDVIDIRIYYTILLEIGNRFEDEQSTGRIVFSPNEHVLTNNVFNYTKGFRYIWNEMSIVVTFESDWEKARTILTEILKSGELKVEEPAREEIDKLSSKHAIRYKTLTPKVWMKITDFGVQLDLRYLVNVRKIRSTENFISERILAKFDKEANIEFAYPTYRIFRQGESRLPVE